MNSQTCIDEETVEYMVISQFEAISKKRLRRVVARGRGQLRTVRARDHAQVAATELGSSKI